MPGPYRTSLRAAAVLACFLWYLVPPAAAQTEFGFETGPDRLGESRARVKVRDKTKIIKLKSNCQPETRPLGRWKLQFNSFPIRSEMNFPPEPAGDSIATYDHNGGTLSGSLEGDLMTGKWRQTAADERCEATASYWGTYKLRFNGAFDAFVGTWNYCGKPPEYTWIGVRDCPAKPFEKVYKDILTYATLYSRLGGKDAEGDSNIIKDALVSHLQLTTKWICDGSGLRRFPAGREVLTRQFKKLERTGQYALPVRYMTVGGVIRRNKTEFWVYSLTTATESKWTFSDFINLPGTLKSFADPSKLEVNWEKVFGAVGGLPKYIDDLKKGADYETLSIVKCEKTPNGRFRIREESVPSFPRIKDNASAGFDHGLYWKNGWHSD